MVENKKIPVTQLEYTLFRDIRPNIVQKVKERIKKDGYNPTRPIRVVPDGDNYAVIDGNHRLKALEKLGYEENIPCVVEEKSVDAERLAIVSNRDEDTYAPMDLFDYLDIIDRLKDKHTQEDIGEKLGWSRSKVQNHIRLINQVDTEVLEKAQKHQKGRVSTDDTNVTNFTEGWFRNTGIYDLPDDRQIQLIQWYTEKQNCNATKTQVKNQVKKLKKKQKQVEYIEENLLNNDKKTELKEDVENGAFPNTKAVKKAVKQENEKYQEKQQHQIHHADSLEKLEEIPDNSVDVLITDPPYNITDLEWDNYEPEDFQDFTTTWLEKAVKKVKPDGRIYIFWSQEHMYDFPVNLIENKGFKFGNTLVWNYRNNIKAHNEHKYKHSYEPIFYFYGEDADKLNMPQNEEWDTNGVHNLDVKQAAVPQSNFKEDTKQHPTQKPEEVLEWLIKTGSYRGDTILDPFAGSGTTAVVAKKLSRKSVSIEKQEKHIKTIQRRLYDD